MNRAPLSEEELRGVERLQRRMVGYYMAGMTALAVGALLMVNYGDVAWLRRTLLAGVLALLAGAVAIQLRARCPRCNGRLAMKSRLRLPERCPTCRIPLGRPPESSA